ncbi:MAG: 50S ribosomal protein L11 methyltransferase [Chloroflexi bacterium]|nr:50S ribosomal protein L11 methyltransferase [Chloroflexota bacterium]
MNWLEVCAAVDVEGVEAVGALFREHVHGGVVIEEDITLFSDREGYRVNVDKPVTVKGYLPIDGEVVARVQRIEESLWHLRLLRPIGPLQTREVAEEDWQESWKQFFHVHRVGRRIIIKPTWQQCDPEPNDVVIDLDPGMAFGTGLHPTTQLCLIDLEERLSPGMWVLDLGTGSGILAIAAAKLGAAGVLAVDVDSVAVEVARQNVELNKVGDRVEVRRGSLPLDSDTEPAASGGAGGSRGHLRFDLVVANIIASVIRDLSAEIARALRPGGLVVASGILQEKVAGVEESLAANGLELISRQASGEWVALIARKAIEGDGGAV